MQRRSYAAGFASAIAVTATAMVAAMVMAAAMVGWAACSFADDYTIGPDDVLAVFVADHPELSIEKASVSRSGFLAHPVWGEVQVQGLLKSQAEAAIRDHLAADFLADPRVTLTILQPSQVLVWLLLPNQATNGYRLAVNGKLSELLIIAGVPLHICNSMVARITRREQAPAEPDIPGGEPAPSRNAPPRQRLIQTTVDLHDLMVLGLDSIDVPLRRNDRVHLVYRDPRIRGTVRLTSESEVENCSYNAADTPALTPAHACIPLGLDELILPGGLPPVVGNCVTVCGAVLHAGAVRLPPDATLGGVVAQAGLSPSAGSLSRIVHITRSSPLKAAVWYMRSASADDGYGLHERLRTGDIIFVIGDAVE